MDEHSRNFLLAIVLSIAVLVGWQVFYGGPMLEQKQAQKEETAKSEQPAKDEAGQTASPGAPPAPSAGPGAPPSPSEDAAPSPAGSNRKQVLQQAPRIPVETPSLSGSISLKGARIDDLVLNKYRQTVKPDSPNVVLFAPSGSRAPFYAEHGWVGGGGSDIRLPNADTVWQREAEGPLTPGSPVTLTWDNGQGLTFRRTIAVDEHYMFTVRQEVENNTGGDVTIYPYALVSRHGKPDVTGFYILHEGLVGVLGEEGLQEIDYDDAVEDKATTYNDVTSGWLGITDKYWAAVVLPGNAESFQARFSGDTKNNRDNYQADYLLDPLTIPGGGQASVEGLLFAGAKQVDLVDGYAEQYNIAKFDLLIDWGWFYFLTKPLFFALDYFYKLVGNFGLSILIVTVLIKLVMFPLANKSYVSMSKMKKLQPEMQRIKERYTDDKTRQQQALMDLYKKEKVNPASGCLPILVQIPVFFALYKVLFVTIEMRHAPFYGWIRDLSAPDPTTIFNLFGLIPWDPPGFLTVGLWPLIMGLTMFVQMRLNPAPPDPMQAKIFAWMPVIFTFILAPFPAGLVIYWAWNNFLSVVQQAYIMHRQGVEIALWDNLGLTKLGLVKKKQAGGGSES